MTPSRAILLTGFMGAGKTSVGAALARLRGCAFHDLDALIAEQAGMPVAKIFATAGEPEFRRMESAALHDVLARVGDSGGVVALGGGTLADTQNLRAVRKAGALLVALDAPVEVLFERTQRARGTRPLAMDEAGFRRLYETRKPLYQAADLVVDSGSGGVESVAAQVEHSIAALIGEWREKR
ncbi:MAG: shikimate kinase [Candidatus Koribacter versatilis]|uniref:Shikimate kinase n=1 Tax=Candidatus Korobacter versatilis TaxID=658062 RepID=A0A932EPR0_9BACT|nr:shikimate kinase [Candidatus Koribacter versatilis]